MALTGPLSGRWIVAALAFVLAGCEKPPKSEVEAAARVLATPEWMADVDTCPLEFMSGEMKRASVADFSCAGSEVSGCFQRCKHADVDSCYWLAYAVQQAKAGELASEALFQRSCSLGEPSGCVNRAAGMMKAGREDPDVLRCSARTFERACEFDDIWGCAMSGLVLWKGLGVDVNAKRAEAALRKACFKPDSQQHEACLAANSMLSEIEAAAAAARCAPTTGLVDKSCAARVYY